MAVSEHDVVVLGGGPAGSLTAALLCRQNPGIRVLVLEREVFPRPHVGEVTLPGWTAVLRRAGAFEKLDAALPIKKLGVVFRWGPESAGESWTADFREEARGAPAAGSWHVDRGVLDQLLLENAEEQGASVVQGARVLSVDGGEVVYEGGTARARWVVDATGQARLLARLWKLGVERFEHMSNLAIWGYWRGSALTSAAAVERDEERWALVNTSAEGWVWHIPIGPDLVSVGLVTDKATVKGRELSELYAEAVASTPGVGELLAGATFVGDRPAGGGDRPAVCEDWAYRVSTVCGPGFFLVGDAAVFVDPVLSSGLTLAANGASMVANAITTLLRGQEEAPVQAAYSEALARIAGAYHRMARVWYGRNLRAESWHWQARQERLQLGQALHESDAEAFTAVCLGVIASPLDAAVGRASRDGWGSEFFNWLVSDHLFAAPNADFGGVGGGDAARLAGRRSVARRWRRLALSRLRLELPVRARGSFHTHRFLDVWEPVDVVDVGDLVLPDFGVLQRLDGSSSTLGLLDDLDDVAVAGVVHTLLQLDMLGHLVVEEGDLAEPRWTGSPAMELVRAELSRLEGPGRIAFEVDLRGRSLFVTTSEGRRRVGLDEPDLRRRVGLGIAFDFVPGEQPVAQRL